MFHFRDLTPFVKWALNGVIFVLSVYLVLMVGPWMETTFRPVISQFEVTSVEALDENRTSIMVRFSKDRNCEFIGIAWYRGLRSGTFERVGLVLLNQVPSNPTRPLGVQRAGPWIVDVPFDDFHNNSFAEITHSCHLLWVTRTHLFP